jgi:Peptidase propeptide and YPEB domain
VTQMHCTLPMIVGSVVLASSSFGADDLKLLAETKIKEPAARATALAQVRNGTVRSEELEREHGHLIYSYDIEVPGKSGIDEVNVDAMTGKVIAKTHEGAKAERREAAAEAKAKAKPKP